MIDGLLQRAHLPLLDGEPRQVEIGDPTGLLGNLDVDAGAARDTDKVIIQRALGKQGDKALLIVSARASR